MPLLPDNVPLVKRGLDLFISTCGFIVLFPILLIISILIFFIQGFPILFHQQRPGYLGRPFTIYKFRTMSEKFSTDGRLLPEEQRVTWLGRVLRTTSLDEVPELINVFKGEMSIVGPRPLLMQYLSRYTPEQARRHDVLPGITGWAQINGRNAITWEDKFIFDVWYVDNWSFSLDIKILLQTVWKVLLREGIDEPGHISSGEFMGSNSKSFPGKDIVEQ
ncbi:MAG TPA: sugar transferase [Anaerolineales bacterium]|jgi:lipopolysaccharide/colanic/teichoic acid biosynthesis glycosyltransferase|nr:sugar transferase [Anaerolineales bacterium]